MIFSRNPARGSRVLNGLALLGVTAYYVVLTMGFGFQQEAALDALVGLAFRGGLRGRKDSA